MITLVELTHKIIDHDDPASLLEHADDYCFTYRRMGADKFILPADHAELLPIIEAYAHRPHAFLRYTQMVRDEVHAAYKGMSKAEEMQEFYRNLVVRVAQASLRDRRRRALAWLEKNYPHATTSERAAWVARLEKQWTQLRRSILAAERKQAGGRLPMSRVSEITEGFWTMVDEDIDAGNLPPLE